MRGQRGTDLHTDGGGDACSPAGTFLISPVLQRRQQHEVVGDLLQCGGGGAQVEGLGGEKTGEIGPVNYMDRGIRVFFVLFMEDLGSAVSTNVSWVYLQRIRIIFFYFLNGKSSDTYPSRICACPAVSPYPDVSDP